MSRLANSKPSPIVSTAKRDTGATPDDICPVCKTSRYMRPDMRLLVNPVCYHKMCESCVDRLFSHGPANCPIPKCPQTLRKNRFRAQTFEDIAVEREVDIRKRVAAVFNRRETEFESLRHWNDYLNDVEDITFNLINYLDLENTERRFAEYEARNRAEIEENASLAEREGLSYSALQKSEREAAKIRRQAARREDADGRREVDAHRRDVLRRLESGQDPDQVARDGQVQLKKRLNRQAAEQRQAQLQAAAEAKSNGSSNLVIKGLKTRTKQEPDKPIDPFGGLRLEQTYYTLQDDYVWHILNTARNDPVVGAGGYDVKAFENRALCEAFAGLGVMIADEPASPEADDQSAGKEVQMEDPF